MLGRAIAATKGRMAGNVSTAKAKAINECAFDPQAHPTLVKLPRPTSGGRGRRARPDRQGQPGGGEAQLVFRARSPVSRASRSTPSARRRAGGRRRSSPTSRSRNIAPLREGSAPRDPEAAPFLPRSPTAARTRRCGSRRRSRSGSAPNRLRATTSEEAAG
jgi:hypothetical protein